MNTMINPSNEYNDDHRYSNRSAEEVAQLVERIAELEASLSGRVRIIEMANESLLSYKAEIRDWQSKHENLVESVTALAHEHLDLEGTEFFDGITDLFNIELTKYVTLQFNVSIEVQAKVPSNMDDDEVADALTYATLDYTFLGNGDIEVEDFTFGDMEQE